MIHLINNHFLKFIIIGLTLLLNYHIAKCQTYHPIPEDSTIAWRMHFEYWDIGTCHEIFLFNYRMKGDTTISNVTYKKIYIENSTMFSHTQGSLYCSSPPINGYVAAFRQDNLLRKAYLVLPNTSADTLLYDFSLSIGDTLNSVTLPNGFFYSNCVDSVNVIDDIDTVLVNNQLHLFQIFSQCGFEVLEEFGSLGDPFGSILDHRYNNNLSCVYKDTAILYLNPHYSNYCSVVLNTDYVDVIESVTIFPSPTEKNLNIKSNESIDNFTIINENNEVIIFKKVKDNSVDIDISNLSAGMYILRIYLKNKSIVTIQFH